MDKILASNNAVRLLSLAVAFLLWLFIVNEQDPEMVRTFMVEPSLEEVPEELVPLEEPDHLTVRLEGRRSDIYDVEPGDLDFFVDLTAGQEGENQVRVQHRDLPGGVRVVDVEPNPMTILLDQRVEVEMPVQLQLEGRPAPGYALGEVEMDPGQVRVSGPGSKVEEVSQVVAPLNVARVDEDINVPQEVRALDAAGQQVDDGVEVSPKVVRVRIPVEEMPSRQVPVEANLFGAPPEGYRLGRVEVDPDSILLSAPEDVLEEVEQVFTYAVDIRGAEETVVRDVRLRLPEDSESRVERARVTVNIVKEETERNISQVPVRVENLEEGLSAQLDPDQVNIRVIGSQRAVDRLSPGNLRGVADLEGLGPGEHQVTVSPLVPDDVQAVQVGPDSITVTITEDD